MGLDGLDGDEELAGHLLVRVPPRDQPQHLALADRQPVQVLVDGGRNQGTPAAGAPPENACDGEDPASFSSAYVWDPAGTAWTRTGLLSVARTDPAIARLADGRVLVAGGYFYTGFQESGSRPIVLAHLATRPAAATPRVNISAGDRSARGSRGSTRPAWAVWW